LRSRFITVAIGALLSLMTFLVGYAARPEPLRLGEPTVEGCRDSVTLIRKNHYVEKSLSCRPGQDSTITNGPDDLLIVCRCPSTTTTKTPDAGP
jgi:hypothetical protein